ncbi:MAG: hypothetical protein RJA07_1840 [Bacteroidota bacterium]|jgi:hypothetical protein
MKKYKCLLVLVILCFVAVIADAQKITISGYVKDVRSGESLIGVTVYNTNSKNGVNSNLYGFYSLTVPTSDTIGLVYSYLGFETQIKKLVAKENVVLNIFMSEKNASLKEVTVSANRNNNNVAKPQMGVIDVPIQLIKTLPAIAGERDLMKIVQLLPGVQSGQEGTTGFFVRGGSADQNLIQLDEATVYNPNHLFGLFSTFNINAIKNVQLIKGGFPANYGGRLSSILDVQMKEGNNKKFSGAGGIGLLSSNLTLEGPIIKDKCSFIISGRRSYADLLARPFLPKNGNKTLYYFYDVNAKINFKLNDKNRLYLSIFKGLDKAEYTGANALNYGINFGNKTATLRFNHQFNSKLFSNTSIIYNDYHLSLSTIQNKYVAQVYSGISDWNVKTDFDYFLNNKNKIKVGVNYSYSIFSPASVSAKIPKSGKITTIKPDSIPHQYSSLVSFYAKDEITFSDRWSADIGIRVPVFIKPNSQYTFIEPRATLKFSINDATSIKAAYTEMNQFIHLVPSSTASLPTDIWISSSNFVKPQKSKQYALGVFKNFKQNAIETSVEFYYKDMKNQVLFKEGTQPLLSNDINKLLVFGNGNSYGAEFFVKKNFGKLTGWVAYTLSKTIQQFDSLNYGNSFPFTYDKRHNLNVVASFELNKKWTFSADFIFTSGAAFTLPVGKIPVFSGGTLYDGIYYDYTTRNNYRYRPYHRLDVSAVYHKNRKIFGKVYESEWVFSIYNLYSRRNPYFIVLSTDPITKAPVATEISLLPIIPSVSFNFKF